MGTDLFSDISYAYSLKPFFIPNNQWSAIGVPNNLNTSDIPAYDTYNSGDLFGNSCNIFLSDKTLLKPKNETISIYPNPASNHITINFTSLNTDIVEITIYNLLGEIIETISTNVVEGTNDKILDLTNYSNGKYLITILHSNKLLMTNFIKTN